MKGFRNTTKTMSGHSFPTSHGFHRSHSRGGTINRYAGGGPVAGTHDRISGEHEQSQLTDSGKFHPEGHSAVHREVPSNEMQAEHGGKGPLTPGYASGGKAHRHFHVHNHYHSGGKVKTKSKSYNSAERATEREVEGAGSMMSGGGHIHDDTSIPSDYPDYKKGGKWIQGAIKHPGALHKTLGVPKGQKIPAVKLAKAAHSSNPTTRRRAALAKTLGKMHHKATGGTIDKLNAGGALYATGGTINKLATGAQPSAMMPGRMVAPSPHMGALGALGSLAARGRGPAMRRSMPMPGQMAPGPIAVAQGGGVSASQAHQIARGEVGKHVAYPAPTGHAGLAKMLRRG